MEELEELLKTHDWYYEFADDMSYWRPGSEQKMRILHLLKELPYAEALAIVDKYIPNHESIRADWIRCLKGWCKKDHG